MALRAVDPPKQQRQSKYGYSSEDADSALQMLDNGESPGDGPFDSSGKARAAATALLSEMSDDDRASIGSRVWEESPGEFHFALKEGRREFKGRKPRKKGK